MGLTRLRAPRVDRLYKKHTLRPADEVFEKLKAEKIPPNYSLRMTQLTAAVIRPQILTLEKRVGIYDRRYKAVEAKLNQVPHITVPKQLPQVRRLSLPSPHPSEVVVLPTNLRNGHIARIRLVPPARDRCESLMARLCRVKGFSKRQHHGDVCGESIPQRRLDRERWRVTMPCGRVERC
jgi:hypothetical protein